MGLQLPMPETNVSEGVLDAVRSVRQVTSPKGEMLGAAGAGKDSAGRAEMVGVWRTTGLMAGFMVSLAEGSSVEISACKVASFESRNSVEDKV